MPLELARTSDGLATGQTPSASTSSGERDQIHGIGPRSRVWWVSIIALIVSLWSLYVTGVASLGLLLQR